MKINYNKGLIRHIEELTEQNERLTAENMELRSANRGLRAQISQFEETLENRINVAVEKAVRKATEPLIAELAEKTTLIAKMDDEIDRLKAQLNRDSGNSSKPPSQDGFKKIPNSRERSTRKSGGQKGHPGSNLQLPKNLDELEEKGLIRREMIDHTDGSETYESRYTMDIDIKVTVTEHRFLKGRIPTKLYAPITYGDKLKALVGLLSVEGFIAYERLSNIIEEVTNGIISLSDGTIDRFIDALAGSLGGELTAIETALLNGTVMGVDDTPLDVTEKPDYSGDEPTMKTAEKSSLSAYMRTHSNEHSTLYTVNPQKDAAGCERDGILPKFTGILSHDHEAKFYKYGTAHATCCAHLMRELKGLFELQKISWANDMRKFMAEMNTHKNADLEAGKTECNKDELAFFETQYDNLMAKGYAELATLKEKELGQDELRKMLARLTNYKDNYLLFIRNYRAPFTNNPAERDLRPDKTKQKVSGCFRSWRGLQNFAHIRSFVSTLKKRSLNLLESFSLALLGIPVLDS